MKPLLLLVALVLAASAQPRISLSGSAVRGGQTATITVTLSGSAGNLAAVQFFLPAPASFSITAAAGSAVTAAQKSLSCARNLAGDVYGCVVSGGANLLADGPLAVLKVATAPGVAASFTLTNLLGSNPAGDSPGVPILAGPVLSVMLSSCDINGDGATDPKDAQNLLDQLTGVIVPAAADLDGDGKTTVIDLQRLVNALVGGACRVGQ